MFDKRVKQQITDEKQYPYEDFYLAHRDEVWSYCQLSIMDQLPRKAPSKFRITNAHKMIVQRHYVATMHFALNKMHKWGINGVNLRSASH